MKREHGEIPRDRGRGCPRNCKRRAKSVNATGRQGWEGRIAQRPASQETCQHELTGRGVPGGNANLGLVGRFASFLPSPVLESDGKLDGSIDPIHRIIVCTLCRDPVTGVRTGADLCADLRARLPGQGDPAPGYAVEEIACMAGCERPLTVAFQAEGKASYLFGSIDARGDAAALVEFAELYSSLADGWCSSGQRPAGLAGKTLARIPGSGNSAGDSR